MTEQRVRNTNTKDYSPVGSLIAGDKIDSESFIDILTFDDNMTEEEIDSHFPNGIDEYLTVTEIVKGDVGTNVVYIKVEGSQEQYVMNFAEEAYIDFRSITVKDLIEKLSRMDENEKIPLKDELRDTLYNRFML